MVRKGKANKNKRIQCPNCESSNVLYRKKNNDFWCRKCGQEFTVRKSGRFRKAVTTKK